MLIGELSKRSQLSRDTIRYYEKLGLFKMGMKKNVDNNYKYYSLEILERLRQIQMLKKCGFTLQEIRILLQGDSCDGLPERLADKIISIEEKLAELMSFKAALLQIHQACTGACSASNGLPDCIEVDKGSGKPAACG